MSNSSSAAVKSNYPQDRADPDMAVRILTAWRAIDRAERSGDLQAAKARANLLLAYTDHATPATLALAHEMAKL